MNLNWFTRKGIIYWPESIIGWIIFIAAVLYVIYLFVDIDSRSHSASDTLINWVFSCLVVGAIYSVVGFLTEKKI